MRLFIVFFIVMTLGACHTSKKAINLNKLKPVKELAMIEKLNDASIHPEWLYTKGNIHFKSNQLSIGVNFSAILRKDSIFVMVVKKMGFVAGKIKITPDSVIILNPWQKKWMGGTLEEIANTFGVPPSFDIIQDMIIGNPMVVTRQHGKSTVENKQYKYMAYDEEWSNTFWINPISGKLNKQILKNKYTRQRLSQELSDYKKNEFGTLFSFFRILELNSAQIGPLDIKINTKNAVWNKPRKIHFSIPEHYERVE